MTHKAHIVSHPLIQHKLTALRSSHTPSPQFRLLVKEIAMLIAYEVTRDLKMKIKEIETPLQKMEAPALANENIVVVSILRAGNGLLEGVLELIPFARVGYIGLYRDPKTLQPVEYYYKVPATMSESDVIVVDPMLATGNSAAAAVARIKVEKPRSIRLVNILAAPEGITVMQSSHPDVALYVAAVDEGLNDHGYIVPGLGDAGDRLYGTK